MQNGWDEFYNRTINPVRILWVIGSMAAALRVQYGPSWVTLSIIKNNYNNAIWLMAYTQFFIQHIKRKWPLYWKQHKSNFFLRYANSKYQLKKGLNYYYPMQGQLHIICIHWSNFLVQTSSDNLVTQWIYLDVQYGRNHLYVSILLSTWALLSQLLATPCHISGCLVREAVNVPFWNNDNLSSSTLPSQD